MGNKVGGGPDNMHTTDKTPFGSARGMRGKAHLGSSTACHPTAAGSVPKNATASANMTARRPLNGPGRG